MTLLVRMRMLCMRVDRRTRVYALLCICVGIYGYVRLCCIMNACRYAYTSVSMVEYMRDLFTVTSVYACAMDACRYECTCMYLLLCICVRVYDSVCARVMAVYMRGCLRCRMRACQGVVCVHVFGVACAH